MAEGHIFASLLGVLPTRSISTLFHRGPLCKRNYCVVRAPIRATPTAGAWVLPSLPPTNWRPDEYAAKHMKAFFYNRARPDIIVSGKGLRETRDKAPEQDWIQKLQGFWRTFKPYFISGEVKVDVIAQNFEHLQLMELRKHVHDTVMQVEGLPPELQGVIENSNRATIDSADYLFSRWTLVPRLEFLRAFRRTRNSISRSLRPRRGRRCSMNGAPCAAPNRSQMNRENFSWCPSV